ncbi:stage 0 sporulation family protein [uncultured Ilyobacter sp.]|uniref:PSP1 domain-containing protein n=1 Tax=uncultured Ilyobacter sp. TaxID=544433 RepID=UPI0029C8651C|nr:stage 0 sporulation family protein [uncultured Ilyobacter sp.]
MKRDADTKEKIIKTDEVKPSEEKVKQEKKTYKVLGVIFEVTKKRYYFEVTDDTKYKKGDKVVVDTARGRELGVVYAEARELPERELVLPLKPVIKKASEEEVERYNNLREESEAAYMVCKVKILEHKLPMKIVASEFTFDKSKLIFYFTAEGRIDFRELVKDLATIFKLRIELRQIGVRDEARILGSIGICGKELCCRTFINKFDSVSIKMARDQGLVINPSKISGACGRLLCCIKYEHTQYAEALKNFPAVNQIVGTEDGDGRVVGVNPLNGYLYVDIPTKGMMRKDLVDIKFNKKEARKLQNKTSDEERKLKGLEKE